MSIFFTGNPDVVKLLIEHGANVDVKETTGSALLHYVVGTPGRTIILKLLLENGADANIQNMHGFSPLHIIAQNSQCVEDANLLLKYGAKVNSRNFMDTTPLHLAVQRCKIQMVQFLFENRADINAKDTCLSTPLHQAIISEHVSHGPNYREVIHFLLDNGADINARDCLDRNPFYLAVCKRDLPIAVKLLKMKAEIYCTLELINILPAWDVSPAYLAAILKELIKLKTLNLINEESYKVWRKASNVEKLQVFEEDCEKEILKMRQEKVCSNFTICFEDFLTKPAHKLALILQGEKLRKKLKDIRLYEKFPIFWTMLSESILNASIRAELLTYAHGTLRLVIFQDKLPDTFTRDVLKCLDNRDLKVLESIDRVQ